MLGMVSRRKAEAAMTPSAETRNRILFPFLGAILSERTLEATLRLAKARDAVLMPAYLVLVSFDLPLDAPLGRECEGALALVETIEQRAARAGVAVDSRIVRGRTPRHAVEELLAEAQFDSIVIPARTSASDGFDPRDVAWILEAVPEEVLVLRPGRQRAGSAQT